MIGTHVWCSPESSKIMKFRFVVVGAVAFSLLSLTLAFASDGVGAGGGGDAQTEGRIVEIRDNILGWINAGNADELQLPSDVKAADYLSGMKSLLAPSAVVVTAIDTAEENQTDEELNTQVAGQPKTCKGFISKRDARMHILCNIQRFAAMSAANQYRQVHHEYASLGLFEKNDGAESDYRISNQLTDKLRYEVVLRLPVTPDKPTHVQEPDSDICHTFKSDGPYSIAICADRLSNTENGTRLEGLYLQSRYGKFGVAKKTSKESICKMMGFDSFVKGSEVVEKRRTWVVHGEQAVYKVVKVIIALECKYSF